MIFCDQRMKSACNESRNRLHTYELAIRFAKNSFVFSVWEIHFLVKSYVCEWVLIKWQRFAQNSTFYSFVFWIFYLHYPFIGMKAAHGLQWNYIGDVSKYFAYLWLNGRMLIQLAHSSIVAFQSKLWKKLTLQKNAHLIIFF